MGHRLSKTSANGCNVTRQVEAEQQQESQQEHKNNQTHHAATSLPHKYAESNTKPTLSSPTKADSEQLITTAASSSSSCPRQIIIKIQLAKMENELQQIVNGSNANDNSNNSNALLPSNNNGTQFLNLSFNRHLTCGELTTTSCATPTIDAATTAVNRSSLQHATSKKSDNNLAERTAGGSSNFVVNNNFSPNVLVTATPGRQDNFNILMGPMSELHIDEKRMSAASALSSLSSSGGELSVSNMNASCAEEQQEAANNVPMEPTCVEDTNELDNEYCCRRKSKSNTFPSKWRCCKCTCRDAFRRIMDASSSKSNKKKERKEVYSPKTPTQQHSSEPTSAIWTPLQTNSPISGTPRNNVGGNAATNGNAAPQMSIWSPSTNEVIIPISSPQFVVVQCPPSSLVTLGRIDDNAIRLMATELVSSSTPTPRILSAPVDVSATPGNCSTNSTSSGIATPNRGVLCTTAAIATGPVVHSQVDYIHCLVPDLERITKASFYWGKMDRYEAERLLEGKPEGTFLLRDSAQEEYLFSVTFRKYGRSLHARIEQSNHKFSFDCHDPCVFTAATVTGLLEHYKDPACVMFFEPMLTIPLHRNTTFSLQQLCRATIVSNTSYDGINELELPSRLKSYLKEYHYKQKLRVKPFDEPFYACT